MDIDGVDVVQTTIGGSSCGFGGASNEVTYQITTDSDADQEALGEQMLSTLETLPEPGEIEDSFDAGALGSSPVDILVTGPTPDDRADAVQRLAAELGSMPGCHGRRPSAIR